jgi:xeroderma pigmentosum group C-complementing protein
LIEWLQARASHPVSYVVAWNNDNTLKDITKRYCTNFNTVTRKLRIDAKWWEDTLKSFTGRKNVRDKEEDEELERQQLEKPLPTSITEYKNHPLYVLKRHLLKFEGIYPPDAPTLGFVRKEAVYSRQCVYTLHSRDIWLKHAKVVKPGEQPYKIVKARPRWDKLSNTVITDQLLEIFGPWQTEDYVPPTAENGVVPRNAFGNVELFKPCMLPKKTVHMKCKITKRLRVESCFHFVF